MARTFADEVVETSSTTGIGPYSLSGAKGDYRTFRQGFPDGNATTYYVVRNRGNTKWEINRGATLTHGTPDTLGRNVVLSTNSNGPVAWTTEDLPLLVYSAPAADALEGSVTGWLAAARHALIRFGPWFRQDQPAIGKHTLMVHDGASDIAVGVVDTSNHTIAFASMPAGALLPFAGSAAPAGFLLAYGQLVSRTTYAALFAAIGTAFGAGDGSTTFGLPDLRGRVIAGKDNMGGSPASRLTSGGSGIDGTALGAAGGAETHTLVTGEIPPHGHAISDPGHLHQAPYGRDIDGGTASNHFYGYNEGPYTVNTALATTGIGVQDTGGGGAHNNTQPTIVLNWIISTGGV